MPSQKVSQLTVRGFDPDLQRRLRRLARKEGVSLNKAALLLMRRGAGLNEPKPGVNAVGTSLDHLIGSWSEKEERDLLDAVAVFEQVDQDFWR